MSLFSASGTMKGIPILLLFINCCFVRGRYVLCDLENEHMSCYCSLGTTYDVQCYIFGQVTPKNEAWKYFQGISTLRSISFRDYEGGNLSFVPSLEFFPDITHLSITHTSLMRLTSNSFSNHSQIQTLKLDSNAINYVESQVFTTLSNIESIDLSGNQITDLSVGMFVQLPNLKYLYLDRNNITFVPVGALSGIGQLQEIYLYQNNISELHPDSFTGLQDLRRLNLRKNKLTSIGNELLKSLSNLEELDLSMNNIQFVDKNAFSNCTRLLLINLRDNEISELSPDLLIANNNLLSVDLSNNFLQDLPQVLFNPIMDNLYNVSMHFSYAGNPVNCSCHLNWLEDVHNETESWVVKSSIQFLTCRDESSADVPVLMNLPFDEEKCAV